MANRIGMMALALGLGLGVAGCSDGYGYSGVSVGYASGGYGPYGYDGYGSYGYDGYGYGAPSYFGWYNDFYYPGTGVYVYDRYRRPYRWNDTQRRYWEGRGRSYRGDRGAANWNGFHSNGGQSYRPDYRQDDRRYFPRGYDDGNRSSRGDYHRYDGNRGAGDGARNGTAQRWSDRRGNDGPTARYRAPSTAGTATPQSIAPTVRPSGSGDHGGWRGGRGRR